MAIDPEPVPTFHLRPARADEAKLIRQRILRERLDPTRLDWRKFVMAEVTGGADRGAILGFAQMKRLGGDVREFGSLVVEADQRRHGVGGALIRYFIQEFPKPIYLVCESRRVRYYTKFGFRVMDDPKIMPAGLRTKWRLGRLVGKLFGFRIEAMIYDGSFLPFKAPLQKAF